MIAPETRALPIEMRLIRLRLMRYRLRLALLLRAARLFATIGERLHGLGKRNARRFTLARLQRPQHLPDTITGSA